VTARPRLVTAGKPVLGAARPRHGGLAMAAGLIGPETTCVTTVHELQLRPAGVIPVTSHDVPADFVVTPERVIDRRARRGPRPAAGLGWDDLTGEKTAAIPLLAAQRDRRP